MKKNINFGKLTACLLLVWIFSFMQIRANDWEYSINIGYNIGGSIPLPLPPEIREIESFTPILWAPHIAVEILYPLNENFGIALQPGFDRKGFTACNRVKSLHTELEMDGNRQNGNFTGKNTTELRNTYITVPVSAVYRTSENWRSSMGIYFAYLCSPGFKGTASDGYIRRGDPTGEKIEVPQAAFDFSTEQNRFDFGLLLAEEWRFRKKLALTGQISWGLRQIFPDSFTAISFDMHNVYGTLGISYKLTE